ncbi:Oidioi.mRNA.OKI2018_I69.chr2.g8062.t2.cds [Oikopleura dioica]|uniref:Oidioi.mRNA.OKI2018_I69.chr2.g8062.t2.cds n=1 Tax=Oikopleura dioica TaxID=34765 RepID=A0ABN7T940_OIKDI|nr:Oidioi.mRNA.OKI2018_I69.chr2.g8062.t2.cds [Oikopleura dioica]
MRKGLLAPQNTFLDTIAERFDGSHSNFVLGNAQIPDQYPIVYCSDGFCELSGLPRCKVMRRSCAIRFVYGEDTRQDIKERIERALRNKEEYRVEVKFHFYSDRESRDQTSQSCQLDIVPIKNETGTVVFFLISVKDISKSNSKINFAREREGRDLKEWRRRSRAILYNISGNIGNISSAGFMKSSHGRDDVESRNSAKKSAISEALGRLRQFREQQKNDIPEYKMASRMPYGVVLHCGTFRSTWDLLIFICTIYVAALVPYQSVFKDSDYDLQTAAAKNDLSMINRSFDVFVEAVFIFDVILNFRTTFVSKSGNVVFNPSLISRNYIRSWFLIDLFAAIPIDLFTLFINFPPDTSTSASNSANDIQVSLNNVQMLKILRLLRLARVAYKLELLTQYGAIALTVSVLIFGMMAHWLACVWYLIGWNELNNLSKC